MPAITMKELLEAGVHFGHQTRRWNPKMKEYIFGERNGIYIIDLQKTLKLFKEAARFIAELASQGKTVLFVGTKRQAQEAIAEEARRCEMFFVNQRWLGGLLTNYATVQKSIKRLKELEAMAQDGRFEMLLKKEVVRLERERKHLDQNLSGIKDIPGLPDALFVIDSQNEQIAVREARKLGIPVVAIVDTNCDPDEVDFVIPGNDDALRAIRLFTSKIADSVVEGHALAKEAVPEAEKAAEGEEETGPAYTNYSLVNTAPVAPKEETAAKGEVEAPGKAPEAQAEPERVPERVEEANENSGQDEDHSLATAKPPAQLP